MANRGVAQRYAAPMGLGFLLAIALALVIIFLTRYYRARETPYKKPIVPMPVREQRAPVPEPQAASVVNPFVIFNEPDMNHTVTIRAGSVVSDNFYIVSGEVGIYPAARRGCSQPRAAVHGDRNKFRDIENAFSGEHTPIAVLRAGDATHSCFDMAGVETHLVKKALVNTEAVPLAPAGCEYFNAAVLEKTCIQPLVQYFKLPELVLPFERLCCTDFGLFVKKNLGKCVSPARAAFRSSISLDECLVWVESGALVVNSVPFGAGQIVGVLGLLFNSCRRGFQYSSPDGATIQYVTYADIARVPTGILASFLGCASPTGAVVRAPGGPLAGGSGDSRAAASADAYIEHPGLSQSIALEERWSRSTGELRSWSADTGGGAPEKSQGEGDAAPILRNDTLYVLPRPFALHPFALLVGVTTQWLRLEPNRRLTEKDTKCNEVYLLDDREIGNMECMREACYSDTFTSDKIADAVRIPRGTIEARIVMDKHFYRAMTQKMFTPRVKDSRTVLITPSCGSCRNFATRLQLVLGSDSVIINRAEIFMLSSRHISSPMGELYLTNYLNALKMKYRVVIIYIENEWSRLLHVFSRAVDLIYVAGPVPVPNRFDRSNVEFVQLHATRVHTSRPVSRLRRLFSKGGQSESSTSEEHENEAAEGRKSRAREEGSAVGEQVGFGPLESAECKNLRRYKRNHHILCTEKDDHCMKDFERLKRYLLNEKVGLVLGGGGARGFAHIGVIRALEEENIPIDCIGGTSMGAFVGALYSQQLDFLHVYSQSRLFARSLGSKWNFMLDCTYPFVSIFTGRSFRRSLRGIFKNMRIQDLWLEFYCVATNLLKQEEKVVFGGAVAKWLRASMSICGVFPPVIIRSEYFVDGAYLNNVPADVMKSLNARTVIAVDVSFTDEAASDPYDSSSGFFLLLKQLLCKKRYISLLDLQYRLTFLGTESKARELNSDTLLIRPDLSAYRTSDFSKFEDIVSCGYRAAKEAIVRWKRRGLISKTSRYRRRFSI